LVRKAFTLIELIFAIVIIAFTVLTLPMLNGVLNQGMENSIVQEAIFGAATKLQEVTTYHWDDNSIDPSEPNGLARVINEDSSCESNNTSSHYRLRPGHIEEPYHRRCLNNLTTTAANANSNSNVDSVDDLNGASGNLFIGNSASSGGYKDSYTYTIAVTPNASYAGASQNNIKKVDVTIKENGDTIVGLSTYVMNIGEVDYYKRTLP